jgi:NAD-dependent dihydropyrimidine dehydrogenase PreA subunit
MGILARADASNRVIQGTNSRLSAAFCTCCGCCCGYLQFYKALPQPALAAQSPFVAALDTEACSGCGICIERCQMDAFTEDGDRVAHNPDRCIGCGLCVSTCPTGALTLKRVPGRDSTRIPETLKEAQRKIAADRAAATTAGR